jgi:hypothetical protein
MRSTSPSNITGKMTTNLSPSSITDAIDDVQTTPMPQIDFTKFGELPVELRLEIWGMAVEEPQTFAIKLDIELIENILPKKDKNPEDWQRYLALRISRKYIVQYSLTTSELPGCLLACHESQCEALKRFPDTLKFMGSPTMYFDARLDTISIDPKSLFALELYRDSDVNYFPVANLGPNHLVFLQPFASIRNLALESLHEKDRRISEGILLVIQHIFKGAEKISTLKRNSMRRKTWREIVDFPHALPVCPFRGKADGSVERLLYWRRPKALLRTREIAFEVSEDQR